jgi:hypothetical protein
LLVFLNISHFLVFDIVCPGGHSVGHFGKEVLSARVLLRTVSEMRAVFTVFTVGEL